MAVQIRIFIGLQQNSEMKMHLNRSAAWKEAKLLGHVNITEIQDQDKEYIGQFVPSLLTCAQLRKIEAEIKSQLQLYCPKLNLDKRRSYLLSQLFFS